jgi:hypothetical protein
VWDNSGTGFSLSVFAVPEEIQIRQAEQAAEKVGRFVGRGFSHDVSALDSSGVLTPEARKCHFSAACEACSPQNRKSAMMQRDTQRVKYCVIAARLLVF